jgi:hypothetical protein
MRTNCKSLTLFWRDPNAASHLFAAGRGKTLLVLALRLFFREQSPRKRGLEHARRADVAIAASSLPVALAHRTRLYRYVSFSRTIRK